jgi:hypothetical protein
MCVYLLETLFMKLFLCFLCWCLLFVLSWPIAILVVVLFPLVWILALPFRLAGVVIEAFFRLLTAIFFLPSKLLGYHPSQSKNYH